jgi:hypothetical protein
MKILCIICMHSNGILTTFKNQNIPQFQKGTRKIRPSRLKNNLKWRQMHSLCHGYMDRVEFDNHNWVFSIYYLGTFCNKKTYYYTDSCDAQATEFYLRRTVPIYKKIFESPIGTKTCVVDKFSRFVRSKGWQSKLQIDDHVIEVINLDCGDEHKELYHHIEYLFGSRTTD